MADVTTPTNLPIPSQDPRDLKWNSGKFDQVINSDDYYYIDRFGKKRYTIAGFQNDAEEAIRNYGYITMDSFEDGATLTLPNQVLRYEATGEYYRWDGAFPKAVVAGSTPATTGGIGIGEWLSVGDATIRGQISSEDGISIIGSANYSQIRAYNGGNAKIQCLGRENIFDEASGIFVMDSSDTTSPDDDGTTLIDSLGRRWKRQYSGAVNVMWFGAIPGDETTPVAIKNRDAFRNATLSMKSAWDIWKAGRRSRSVYVPAGDFNLSNGFCVPKGCSIFSDGLGVARLKVLGATADASNKLPLISMGRVINDSTLATEVTTGAYVNDPAPFIDQLYLNPQNSGTAVDVTGVPGFCIGTLWIQSDVGINIDGGSGDGIIGKIFAEDSTGVGIRFGACQNITVDNLYTFLCSTPVVYSGDSNNTRLNNIQANYTTVAAITTNDGANIRGAKIGSFVSKHNVQYPTFTSVIRFRSSSCDMTINEMDARNYNGYAFNNETGINNSLHIGSIKLRQASFASTDTAGVSAKGCRVNNCALTIDNVDIAELGFSPFEQTGSFSSSLVVKNGFIGGLNAAVPIVDISVTNDTSSCDINVEPPTGLALFNQNSKISPIYHNVRSPFPLVTEGGRKAIKIPFIGSASAWELTISANTNPSGSPSYKRIQRWFLSQETSNVSSAQVTSINAQDVGNSALSPGFTPNISLQTDVGTVGAGTQVSYISNGYAVVSLPSTYTNINYSLKQL